MRLDRLNMRLTVAATWTLLPMLGGCAAGKGPEVLTVSAAQYEAAFDTAAEAARRNGLAPVLRDRRGGVIETDSRSAGTLIEPWRSDNASLAQAFENTVAQQRRRARFEFTPVQLPGTESTSGDQATTTLSQPALDLTQATGDLELRVWVFVERAHEPGDRRDSWSRRSTTSATLVVPEGMPDTMPRVFWTAAERDTAYERRLLAAVQKALAQPTDPSDKTR